jgi:hypothetical protein
MAAAPIEIPIKLNGLAAIKSELRELKGELANATDPKQMQELAMRAGELKDQLADANEQVAVFASGSKFEQVSNSFGSMKDSLMSLDFEEAASKAKMFQQTLGSISPATIGNGIKGLVSVVGSLSKAFIQFGISLLANPIFLLVAAIVAIVAVIALVMNKLGILKPILNAVGKVFGWIGDAIDMVVQAFKDLCDWLGLSNNAAEDAADAQAAAAEKTAAAYEEKSKAVIGALDREIELAKLDGKNTVYQEKEKQYYILKTAVARLEAIKQKMVAARLSGDLDEEEILALRKGYNEQRELVKDSMHQIAVQDKTEANRKRDEAKKESEEHSKNAKSNADKQKEINAKKVEAEKKYQADRLAAARMYQDLDIQLMDEGVKKELLVSKLAYDRLIQDTQLKYNEKKTHTKQEEEENIKLIEMYGLLAGDARDKINQKESERKKEADNIALAKEKEQTDLLKAMRDAVSQDAKEKEIADVKAKSEADLLALGSSAEAEIFVKEQKEKKLAEIEAKYAEIKIANHYKELSEKADIASKYAQSVNSLAEGMFSVSNSYGKQDEKSKEERAKRQFYIQKAMNLGMATIDGYKAITAFLSTNPLTVLGIPNPGAIAGLVATSAMAAGNVLKIASAKYGGKGTPTTTAPSGGGGGAGSDTSTQQATPNVNLFGANNNANTFGANGQQQGGQMVVKAIVVESDVTSVQNKMSKIQQSAVL